MNISNLSKKILIDALALMTLFVFLYILGELLAPGILSHILPVSIMTVALVILALLTLTANRKNASPKNEAAPFYVTLAFTIIVGCISAWSVRGLPIGIVLAITLCTMTTSFFLLRKQR